MWRRIRWVANGLTVQGGLELLVAFALLMGAMDSDTKAPANPYESVAFGIGPYVLLAGGALKTFAASRNRRFRSRGIGVAALWSGLPTALVWVCAPTGVALLVFGIIVYADPTSREAFELAGKGAGPEEIARVLAEGKG
jgi:hypothetical protein